MLAISPGIVQPYNPTSRFQSIVSQRPTGLQHVAILLTTGLLILGGCNQPSDAPSAESESASSTPSGDTTSDSSVAATGADAADRADTEPEEPGSGDAGASVELKLIDFAGLQDLVDQQTGKITLIDIWSTACLPCMQEFPNLVELSKQYPDKLTCISLNVDYIGLPNRPPESYQEKVLAFLEKQAATEVHNYLATEPDTDILDKANAESMPAILIYDTEGELVATLTDATAGEEGLSYEGTVIPKLQELLDAQ